MLRNRKATGLRTCPATRPGSVRRDGDTLVRSRQLQRLAAYHVSNVLVHSRATCTVRRSTAGGVAAPSGAASGQSAPSYGTAHQTLSFC
jgi:hypothetical protein